MKNTRQNSASIKKKVTNVLVHLFLTILSVIWVFPIFWVVLLSRKDSISHRSGLKSLRRQTM